MKIARWGDCPSAWIEQHNVGSVCAQLGDTARGRALVADALAKMRASGLADDRHISMAENTLELIGTLERR